MRYKSGMNCKLCKKALNDVARIDIVDDDNDDRTLYDLSLGGRLFLVCNKCLSSFFGKEEGVYMDDGVIVGKKAPPEIIEAFELAAKGKIEVCPQCGFFHEVYFFEPRSNNAI
jgi:hypothetical protein